MIQRLLTQTILNHTKPGFIAIIYGARRVGKTVLLEQIKAQLPDKSSIIFNGDTLESQEALQTTSEVKIANIVKDYDVIMIDEAQRIPNISLALKIMIDKFPNKKIFVTGSSSLELGKGMHEHLTGRNITFTLYPFSTKELTGEIDKYKIPFLLDEQLIYGSYPYLQQLSKFDEKQEYLQGIVTDYLFKDVLELERVGNKDNLKKIAMLLAFQIGNVVSWQELSRTIGIDVKTVSRYISLLERSFVIFQIGAFSSNLRKEITKSKKYFFYDLGIRNALINQFFPLNSRNDVGGLWENFLFVERLKKQEYTRVKTSYHFWRNYQNAEVDMVEVASNKISAFEFKWADKSHKTPKQFLEQYQVKAEVIHKENYLDFVM